MNTLQDITNGFHTEYHAQQARSKAIQAEAERARTAALRYQRIAAQKMGEYYRLLSKSSREEKIHWTDGLLRPLLVEIERRTGWEFDNKDDLRTYGLRSECPVHIWDGTKNEHGFKNYQAYITFTPELNRDDEGFYSWELYFDTGERTAECYPSGSIGALNGFNKKRARVESVEQIIDFLQRQMDEAA
jgi:hypothetical protein